MTFSVDLRFHKMERARAKETREERVLHMELASSENHHKPHNINPRFNNYSISVAGGRTLRVSSVLN